MNKLPTALSDCPLNEQGTMLPSVLVAVLLLACSTLSIDSDTEGKAGHLYAVVDSRSERWSVVDGTAGGCFGPGPQSLHYASIDVLGQLVSRFGSDFESGHKHRSTFRFDQRW